MPTEATKETLTFKSENEREQALMNFEDRPPSSVKTEEDTNEWIREQEEKQKSVMEAEIVPEEEIAPETPVEDVVEPKAPEELPEPQVPEVPAQEESQIQPEASEKEPPPKEEDIIQFSYKHEDLPESLQGYKDPQEIIRQADHARRFANKAEKEMKEMAEEKDKMSLELEEYKKLKGQDVSAAPAVSTQIPEAQTGDLSEQLKKIDDMEDSDYMAAGEIKNVLGLAVSEIATTRKEFDEFKSDVGVKLTTIQKTNDANTVNDENARQQDAVVRGINELQEKHSELKTAKPVSSIMGQTDCVERDVAKFADQILFSKYGNSNPTWQHRNAIVNAFLEGSPEITAYCQQNAITPESVGSTADDIQKYATIMNVDANMRGEEIDKITGERKQKISPFNGNPVNFGSYIASYNDLKNTHGITRQEQKKQVAEAEIRGQQSLTEALEARADTPKTLGGKGSLPPEVVKEMTEEKALALINNIDEFKMDQQALTGNRSLFHEYNKALKIVKFEEISPPEQWPDEKK